MAWILQFGIIVFLLGMVWSLYVSFKVSSVAAIGNFLFWPFPYLYCVYKDFERVKYSFFVLIAGVILICIGIYYSPAIQHTFTQTFDYMGTSTYIP